MRKLLHSLVVPTLLACSGLFAGSAAFGQTISTVAGGGTFNLANNVPAALAQLFGPTAVAVDTSGNYYFADCNPSSGFGAVIYKVTATTGIINIVAGTGAGGYTGDGGPATSATFSNQIYGLTVAPSGNIYISDDVYSVIRKVTVSTGIITTYAGDNPTHAVFGGGYNGDGIKATSAFLHAPAGIYSTSSTLYIADAANHRVRMVNSSTGIISTIAGNGTSGYTGDGGPATSAELVSPSGVSPDSLGNIYITDVGQNDSNSDVRKVTASTGEISTYAGGLGGGPGGDGGPATSASLNVPKNLALDSSGNLYIADTFDDEIREVSATSLDIKTIAGNGSEGFSGDGGPAVDAEMRQPYAVAVDGSGNIYIADYLNARIRMVN
jgi:hypothetical protein